MDIFILVLLLLILLAYFFRRLILWWVVRRVLKRVTGGLNLDDFFGRKAPGAGRSRQAAGASESKPRKPKEDTSGQIFGDDEGSYVDFEEVKDPKR